MCPLTTLVVKMDPEVEDVGREWSFPPAGFSGNTEQAEQDTYTEALGGGGCRQERNLWKFMRKITQARRSCG